MMNQEKRSLVHRCLELLKFFICPAYILSILFTCGCRNCEVVETALRMREHDLLAMREELLNLELKNQALKRQVHDMRHGPALGTWAVSPERVGQTYLLKRVTLGRSTGGFDDDNIPGDEALQVIIEPRDLSDDVIKAPGSAHISALEISPQGIKTPIGAWSISKDRIGATWKQGLFTTGFVLVLPWQKKPTNERVRIVVRFRLTDGRVFEADKDVRLRLPLIMPRTKKEKVLPLPLPRPVPHEPGKAIAPLPATGPVLEQTSRWRTPGLQGAFRLHRPVPLQPALPPQRYR